MNWTGIGIEIEYKSMRKILILPSCFLFLLLFWHSLFADGIKTLGVPYVQNYSKASYFAGNQNWSVTKDHNGIMYFGNTKGLLSFDGKYWQLYKMPKKQIIRAVVADGKNNIYTGGFGEFGYWAFQKGHLRYTSLVHLVPPKFIPRDEIWKIYLDKGRVIFQSFSSIFIYQKGGIKVIKAENPFLFMHKVGERFFAEVIGKGLFELKNDKLYFINGSQPVCSSGVLSILPFKNNTFLIGTAKNGLYIFDGISFKQWVIPANDFLKTNQLNNGAVIQNKYYAYGTILNGMIILDDEGNIIQRINKSSGLQNNTILSLYIDNDENLWAGLDNGIDRVELNSPLYFYFDKTGLFGTVYTSVIYKGYIYLGTNQGLFYSPWAGDEKSFNFFDFKLIPNSQGQVWDLSILDDQLLCGHNNGTFRVNGQKLENISSVSGGWTIRKLNSDAGYMVQGTYTGLALYKKQTNGLWQLDKKIGGFGEPSRFVEEDPVHDGIWVSHAYKGLYKLTLDKAFNVSEIRYFDEKNGLPDSYNVNIFNLSNRIVFTSEKGFYVYDNLSNQFSAYRELNSKLGSYSTSNRIISAGGRKYWFLNHGKIALVDFSSPGKMSIDSTRFDVLDNRMVQYYENISRINQSIYLISVDDGFVIYNSGKNPVKPASLPSPAIRIRRVENITDKYEILSEDVSREQEINLLYDKNNIRISYALPYYRQSKIQYSYYLEGYSRHWSEWSDVTQKEFTNLNPGEYIFRVKAKINEEIPATEAVFAFSVSPPWYQSLAVKIIYLLLVIVALYYLKRFYNKKLSEDQQKITHRLQLEKEEYLKQESLANEKRISRLQTDKLQTELAGKKRELANSAMSLVYKNELLQKISKEIQNFKDDSGKKLSEDQLRKIQKVIQEGMNDERDWSLFESSFNEAHESFFKKLKVDHPDLVPNDLKFCAYLRMNMSSKEIASLLNISLRGVEIRRYRLRKKLNVPHDKNLVEFLMEL